MGTLVGHIVPGCTIMLVGLWWFLNNLYNFYKSRYQDGGKSFRSRASFSTIANRKQSGRKWHVEATIGFTLFFVGTMMEFVAGFVLDRDAKSFDPDVFQHIAMYSCGLLRIAITVLCYRGNSLPPEVEHFMTGIAFLLQGPLLYSHTAGKNASEQMIHFFTMICWMVGGLGSFFESAYPKSIMATLTRCYFIILGALWFVHAGGFLMYVHPFNTNHFKLMEHAQLHFLTAYFTFDALIVATVMFTAAAMFDRRLSRNRDTATPPLYPPGTHKLMLSDDKDAEEEDALLDKSSVAAEDLMAI